MDHAGHSLHFMLSQCGDGTLGLVSGFVAGVASSVHCLAMCGAIATAISMRGAPAGSTGGTVLASRLSFLMQAQIARVALYTALGAAAGLAGASLTFDTAGGLAVLRWLSALVLVVMGLSITGWSPMPGLGARLASPVLKRLHYLHRVGAVGTGLAWGLMPCSMVWLMTGYAGLTGNPGQGALVMAGFGLGTLPALTAAATGAGALASLARQPGLRIGAGLLLIAFAVVSLL